MCVPYAEEEGSASDSDDDGGLHVNIGVSTMSLNALHSLAMVPEGEHWQSELWQNTDGGGSEIQA
jgi:hypothetical protein